MFTYNAARLNIAGSEQLIFNSSARPIKISCSDPILGIGARGPRLVHPPTQGCHLPLPIPAKLLPISGEDNPVPCLPLLSGHPPLRRASLPSVRARLAVVVGPAGFSCAPSAARWLHQPCPFFRRNPPDRLSPSKEFPLAKGQALGTAPPGGGVELHYGCRS